MDEHHVASADRVRARIGRGLSPSAFRETLLAVPPGARDEWVDRVLGIGDLLPDGPDLPAGCVPYLPCPVDVLLRVVERAPVRASDVFVDVGSGAGRAAALVHLLTGAGVVGLEIQSRLVQASRDLTARLLLSRVSCVQGDAADLARFIPIGSVFFLYCPFGGARLEKLLTDLEPLARARTISVCTVDVPLPPRAWLREEADGAPDLAIYRSTLR